MLKYVRKLTLQPAEITEDDVRLLRKHGFNDEEILNIAQMTSLFAYLNRMADGLGVTLEEDAKELAVALGLPPERFHETEEQNDQG